VADILLIAGLSGAGRSQAADDLEDLGWFVVDNMPTELIDKVVEIAAVGESLAKLALVVSTPTAQRDVVDVLKKLRLSGHRVRMLFIAQTEAPIGRTKNETRLPTLTLFPPTAKESDRGRPAYACRRIVAAGRVANARPAVNQNQRACPVPDTSPAGANASGRR